jgi:hypothetical protein
MYSTLCKYGKSLHDVVVEWLKRLNLPILTQRVEFLSMHFYWWEHAHQVAKTQEVSRGCSELFPRLIGCRWERQANHLMRVEVRDHQSVPLAQEVFFQLAGKWPLHVEPSKHVLVQVDMHVMVPFPDLWVESILDRD